MDNDPIETKSRTETFGLALFSFQRAQNRRVTHRAKSESWIVYRLLVMYGPLLCRKRKVRVTGWSAQMYSAFVGAGAAGQDGMRRAPFPISYAVSKDFCRVRVWGALGSTAVPSHDSLADLLPPDFTDQLLSEAHRLLVPGGKLCLVSMTFGTSPVSRAICWGWQRLWRLRPGIVGGCHLIELSEYLRPECWKPEHQATVTSWESLLEFL